MLVFHRPALVSLAAALLAAPGFTQPTPTPEDEVLAMLREWRKIRVASGEDPMRLLRLPAETAESAVPGDVSDGPPRIRVGSGVQEMARTFGPQPTYPEEARTSGIEGVVTLEALIGVDGAVQSLTVIDGDPLLAAAALETVKTWTYRRTLLNGTPVEVVAEIRIAFGVSAEVPRKKR